MQPKSRLPSRAAGQQASDADVGADALTGAAQRIWIYLRDSDSPCHWGGEEFIILMPHSDLDQVCLIAKKLRALFAAEPLSGTISIRSAQWQPEQGLGDLLHCADLMLYRAAQLGRNRVEGFSPCTNLPLV